MDVATAVNDLVQLVLSGRMMDAFEKYYADDVVMQENDSSPRKGKKANREFEQQFMGSVKQVHAAQARNVAVAGTVAMIEWFMDITFKDGRRRQLSEVAVQRWKDGKVVSERFYYDPAASK